MKNSRTVMVDNISKVYPHRDCDCFYLGYNFMLDLKNTPVEGIIGGYFDELFVLKKGKKYKITVEEIK